MTPSVAVGIMLLLLFNGQNGLINKVLGVFGISGPNWTTDPSWVKPGLILMSLWTVGSSVIILLAALRNVPLEMYESARVDGANFMQQTTDHAPDDFGHHLLSRNREHDRRIPNIHRGIYGLFWGRKQHL